MSGPAPNLKDAAAIIEKQEATLAAVRSQRRSALDAVMATFDGFNIEGSLLMLVPHDASKDEGKTK